MPAHPFTLRELFLTAIQNYQNNFTNKSFAIKAATISRCIAIESSCVK
jgi:hypothetical protein